MSKILPILKNSLVVNNFQRNKKNILHSSLVVLSLLSSVAMNSCSKYAIEPEEDIFEKTDSTDIKNQKNDNSGFDVVIDSTDIREYTFNI